jgi:hypothetical protein
MIVDFEERTANGTTSGIENSHLDPLAATRRAIVRAAAEMADNQRAGMSIDVIDLKRRLLAAQSLI